MTELDCDVLIVGGSLVGSALANALGELELRIVLVEAKDPGSLEQPGFDARATALANGSRRILDQLGLWAPLRADAAPITHIHVGEQGQFGAVRIDAEAEGVEALGYTVENRALGRVLWGALQDKQSCRCLAPASLTQFSATGQGVAARVRCADQTLNIRARLAVAADGADSWVRRALDIDVREDDYAQHAVILNCATEIDLAGRAFERFTLKGPLALLPLTRQRAAVVWTLASDIAADVAGLDDETFRMRLQSAFGHRLGEILRVGKRSLHPLRRVQSAALSGPRTALIGSAAVNLHPVAGQGFNLALRDVATLAELIADEQERKARDADPGSVLARYREWRALDQRKLAAFTHGLVRVFAVPALGPLRGLGLLGFDLLPGGKALLARHTMGMAGRLPRLARGLPLRAQAQP